MSFFEREMRLIEMYGRRGWGAARNAATANIITRDNWERKSLQLTAQEKDGVARQWGRLNFQSVVRYVPKTPVFVHCHECRWPVNPGRTHMLLGNEQRTEATEAQMQMICDGVRIHMGVPPVAHAAILLTTPPLLGRISATK